MFKIGDRFKNKLTGELGTITAKMQFTYHIKYDGTPTGKYFATSVFWAEDILEKLPEIKMSEALAMLEPKPDAVTRPQHYNQGKIEVIEFIEDKKLNYHKGNAIKYISRAGIKNKDKEIEDLRKAIWYLEREIATIEASNSGTAVIKPNDMKK